jgi:hypothetical protein
LIAVQDRDRRWKLGCDGFAFAGPLGSQSRTRRALPAIM